MSSETELTKGYVRFSVPDLSISGKELAIYSPPISKSVKQESVPLHDFRTATDVAKGAEGLDVQGFTWIKHQSSLKSPDEFITGRNIEDIYVQECIDLIKDLTGAKKGVVHNVALRRQPRTRFDPNSVDSPRRGDASDQAIMKLPRDRVLVNGRDDSNHGEPAQHSHIDHSLRGLRDTFRMCRRDITAAAKEIVEAEDARAQGAVVRVPRYASYSVWRPLKPVKRDPIAVLDWRTLDKSELVAHEFRALSEMTEDGEYMIEAYMALPPKLPDKQKWYWMSEQKPDEVLIIKFGDSKSEEDETVAGGCVHSSPIIPGTENEEVRQSVEVRVYAFWG
ncbi:hypothetical protein EJ03DRAFT_351027 [Teratosphaeria nubilosa]|uniref:GA4 desaturase n=1 Tax=Teratosphaeria nubilosa TaxID=161662 RepID=A0A6G1LA83_9PEZI|nr:hypothetical protein EJ03DRAFT_351027 [Teratosphaeria nubilosa]